MHLVWREQWSTLAVRVRSGAGRRRRKHCGISWRWRLLRWWRRLQLSLVTQSGHRMRAVVTRPGEGRAWLAELDEPAPEAPDDVVVDMLRVGICGTDRHVMARGFGPRQLPAGSDVLVLGHEAVGRVQAVGLNVERLRLGDLVVPTVRRGCAACPACAAGQADLCFSGAYRERGIVGLHGFLSERIVEREGELVPVPAELGPVAPLVESLTTPEKALRRIDNARAHLPLDGGGDLHGVRRALVTGSGPIALLAVMALRLLDIDTYDLARQPLDGPAARIIQDVGATYVPLAEVDLDRPQERLGEFDAIIEATGAVEVALPMIGALARNGVLDLAGGGAGPTFGVKPGLFGSMVGRNLTVLGSVNANADDWRAAVRDLRAMQARFPGVVERLITHTFTFDDVAVAFERVPGQIKAVFDISN
jgi:glucose 1-dehydrogenase